MLRCYFLCYVRSCDSPKGTVSFKTGLILIARVLISKKRQRFNFLKMSCYWRIRRIRPIALKCCIHVLYAVTDPAKGAGGGRPPLIFRSNSKIFETASPPPPLPYLKVWIPPLLWAMLHCCYLFKMLKRVFASIDFQKKVQFCYFRL